MIWQAVCNFLRERIAESSFTLWIEPLLCMEEGESCLRLGAPDPFFCSWVSDNYRELILEALAAIGRSDMELSFTHVRADNGGKRAPGAAAEQLRLPGIPVGGSNIRTLHPRYTFDEFMVGESNSMAHVAAQAIAAGDTALGRCLYIGAGTGLGKSHLTHAVAHHIITHSPVTRLHYLTARQLTAEMVKAIRNNTMEAFKEKYYNNCDVLLMEDVHALAGRLKTQEELAMAIDCLMESGKRVIFTGSVPPRAIPDLDEMVRSRLCAGLITTINPPDLKTRYLIIRRKANNCGLRLSEEATELLADKLRGDIRRLESAIVGIKAKSNLLKKDPDMEMVKDVLADIMGHVQEMTTEVIRDFLADQFRVSVEELMSKSRKQSIAFPRQMSMYLARKLTEQPLVDIGRAFNRDHSTVVHAIRVITDGVARDATVRNQVELLARKLQKKYL